TSHGYAPPYCWLLLAPSRKAWISATRQRQRGRFGPPQTTGCGKRRALTPPRMVPALTPSQAAGWGRPTSWGVRGTGGAASASVMAKNLSVSFSAIDAPERGATLSVEYPGRQRRLGPGRSGLPPLAALFASAQLRAAGPTYLEI